MSYFLILAGPMLSLLASSWVIVWLAIELSVLGLISSNLLNAKTKMKYYLIQALASCALLYGGAMNQEIFVTAALMFKLGLAPFFWWVPGVVGAMDLKNSLLLLTWMKVPSFSLLMMLVDQYFILLASVTSILVGSWLGLKATNLMGMLAYSSISQSGWISMGLLSMKSWTYFLLYSLSLLSLIYDKKNLSMLSLAGMPPFLLFWAKLKIILTANAGFYYWLVAAMVFSLVFYLKFFMKYTLSPSKPNLGLFLSLNFLALPFLL